MIKVEYDKIEYQGSEDALSNAGISWTESGHSIGVSTDLSYELTYNTDAVLGFEELGVAYPQFPKARNVSVQVVFDVVNITVLETVRVFLGR